MVGAAEVDGRWPRTPGNNGDDEWRRATGCSGRDGSCELMGWGRRLAVSCYADAEGGGEGAAGSGGGWARVVIRLAVGDAVVEVEWRRRVQ